MASVPLRRHLELSSSAKTPLQTHLVTTAGSAKSLPAYVINGSLKLVRVRCTNTVTIPSEALRQLCQLSSSETDKRGVQNLSEADIQAEGLD